MTTAPVLTAWHRGLMLGLDTETSGTKVETDRVVTAAAVYVGPGSEQYGQHHWLADPGVEIPAEASAIHGITTDKARAEGRPARDVIQEVITHLASAERDGIPVVLMNASFDLTILDREARRHGLGPLPTPTRVIDVRVLDKACDPYRRGGRKLTDLCQAYGVKLDAAHDAGGDALGALRVAWTIAQRFPELQIDPLALHERQVRWHAAQVASFADYRRRQGQPLDDENGEWPVRSLPEARDNTQPPTA